MIFISVFKNSTNQNAEFTITHVTVFFVIKNLLYINNLKYNKMELKAKADRSYLANSSWQDLYARTEHWKSDIEFYRDESRFLRTLIDKYFIWLIKDGNIAKVQSLSNELSKTVLLKKEVYNKITKHLMHIEELMENPFSHDENKVKDEHLIIEDEFAEFVKKFKLLKREIFATTEHVIEDEKGRHLLTI